MKVLVALLCVLTFVGGSMPNESSKSYVSDLTIKPSDVSESCNGWVCLRKCKSNGQFSHGYCTPRGCECPGNEDAKLPPSEEMCDKQLCVKKCKEQHKLPGCCGRIENCKCDDKSDHSSLGLQVQWKCTKRFCNWFCHNYLGLKHGGKCYTSDRFCYCKKDCEDW